MPFTICISYHWDCRWPNDTMWCRIGTAAVGADRTTPWTFFLGSYIFRSYQCIWESMPQSSFLSTAFLQPQNFKLLFQWTLLFQWYTSPCISHKKPAFHIKSLSILLDPYCEIETYAMDKKQEFVLSKGLHWVSIPSEPQVSSHIHAVLVMKQSHIHSLLPWKSACYLYQKRTPLIGYNLLASTHIRTTKIHLAIKVTIITPLQQCIYHT